MKTMLLGALCALTMSVANAATPPANIDQASFAQWLTAIGAPQSPYAAYVFGWYESQKTAPLPAQVGTDPDRLFVSVDRPLAEAVRLEGAGDVDEGTTYGLETYGILDAPIATVLETVLFRWGKPVGQQSGVTYPNDTVFGYREEKLAPEWGPGSYKTLTTKRNGGIADDQHDIFTLLVRGNAQTGYVLVGGQIGNFGPTTSISYITIIMIKPTADGKTDYRVAGMLSGQNYSFFGLENGRKNFGFNVSRIREGQKDFYSQVKALKETGRIPERH